MRKLKDPCPVCSKPLDPSWKISPYCEADIAAAAPSPRRARRLRDGTAERPVAGGFAEGSVAGATGFVEGSTPAPAERGGPAGT
jgi:hypothetical protein